MVTCKHRADHESKIAICALAQVEVHIELCRRCLEASKGEPDPQRPNWFLASAMLAGCVKAGIPDKKAFKAAQAGVYRGQSRNAGMVMVEPPKRVVNAVLPPKRSQCQHLGEYVRSEECQTCIGKVMIKRYACNHPAHETTTIAECRFCDDHVVKIDLDASKPVG